MVIDSMSIQPFVFAKMANGVRLLGAEEDA